MEIRDAYEMLFKKIGKDEFFEHGIKDILFVESDKIEKHWIEGIKHKLDKGGEMLHIRGYGRDGSNTELFVKLYKHLFPNIIIERDSTNNAQPTKLLADLTPYVKVKTQNEPNKTLIQNYQISHLWGKTKNPLLFTAAWNIAYVPKYLDPFTGHESQGEHSSTFKRVFEEIVRGKFQHFIDDYNSIIESRVDPVLEEALDKTRKELRYNKKEFSKFSDDARRELSKI